MSYNNIEEALSAFLLPNNDEQKKAEEFLNNIPLQNFDEGINQFLQGMDLENQQLSQLSAVYLKKKYLDTDDMITKLNEQQVQQILNKVQSSVNSNRTYAFLQRSFEILVKLYSYIKKEDMIMDMMLQLSQNSSETKMKKSLMYMIEITCEYSFDDQLLIKHSQNLSALFGKYLEDSELEVRTSAFRSLCIFLGSIGNESLVKQFSGVFPVLLSKCIEALKEDSESGSQNLSSLVDLCDNHPQFVRPILNDLVNLYTEIVQNAQFSEQVRIQGFYGIQTLCEKSSSQIRKCELFKSSTVKAIMMTMTEIENLDLNEWNKELIDELLSQQHPSIMAMETLGKIGPDLGVKFLLPLFIPLIKDAICSSEWKYQHAGLMGISMLSEGCKEVYAEELDNIFNMVNTLESSTNPRIIQALLKTFALLAEEYTPDFQTKYGEQVLSYITKHLSHELLKVQYTALMSLVTFARSLQDYPEESKILSKYSSHIFQPVAILFQKGVDQSHFLLLEEALSCLSVIACVIGESFEQYYKSFMPGLQQLLQIIPTTTQQQINIRVMTIEAMGYFVSSIKNSSELFNVEAQKLMNDFLAMQQALPEDDSHHAAIYGAMGQIAEGMGQNFNQYMNQIFDRVLACVQNENITQTGEKSSNKQNIGVIQKTFDLGMFGSFNLSLNQSVLEQKIEGAQLILKMAKALGKSYFPYVEKTLAVIMKFFSYKHSQKLREACQSTVQYLLLSCETDQNMAQIMNACFPTLLQEFENCLKIKNVEQISFLMEQLGECLKMFRSPLVDIKHIQDCLTFTSKALQVCNDLKAEIKKEFEGQDMDEEDMENMEDQLDEVNAIMRGSIEIIGATLKAYNTQVEGIIIHSMLPFFHKILKNKTTSLENEVFNALYVFDTLMEFCSEQIYGQAYSQVEELYTSVSQCEKYQTPDILQNLVYGYQIIAKRTQASQFNQNLNQILNVIQQIIDNPKSQDEEHISCTETAIGTIGRVVLYQLKDNAQMRDQLMSKFLQSLPLKHDSEEAQNTHQVLFEEILNKNPALFANEAIQNQLKQVIVQIKDLDSNNPESEILSDKGRQLLTQVLAL